MDRCSPAQLSAARNVPSAAMGYVFTAALLCAVAACESGESRPDGLQTPWITTASSQSPGAGLPAASAAAGSGAVTAAGGARPPTAASPVTSPASTPNGSTSVPGPVIAGTPVTVTTVAPREGAAPYSQLPDGRGGINIEQVAYPAGSSFDKAVSLAAFQETLYPLLRANCATCHSTDTRGQAPIHSDVNVNLAHEYALTRVNFHHPEDSKFVVRQVIDRHNCFGKCSDSGAKILKAVQAWADAVQGSFPATPRLVPEETKIAEQEITQWIAADRATLAAADSDFMVYASLHEMHNAGVSADRLNVARAGLSKALNSTARWAPKIVNPVDINGKGIVYRFDIRNYWGYNKGVKTLIYGGSDDDIFFGDRTDILTFRFNFAPTISADPNFAKTIWNRVKQGSLDAYKQNGATTNITGFKPEYVEAGQLVYTLSRPDVYNAIMSLPTYAPELESELGVIKKGDYKSYQYLVIEHAITIDSRLVFRAATSTGGFYYKTFDLFALGKQQVNPFWDHPIPKFVSAAGAVPKDLSLVGSLVQPVGSSAPAGCNASSNGGFSLCTSYTGDGGVQQSASEIIWDMPNGLQGYAIYGGLNQRRVDAFSFIVRDPRRLRTASDASVSGKRLRTATDEAVNTTAPSQELRLMTGGSCMGCHIDGMNRMDNSLRDNLDGGTLKASWVGDATLEGQVREVYPPRTMVRPMIEQDRTKFFNSMSEIRGGMVVGENKNVYVEPIVWSFEWAQKFYKYADTVSN